MKESEVQPQIISTKLKKNFQGMAYFWDLIDSRNAHSSKADKKKFKAIQKLQGSRF